MELRNDDRQKVNDFISLNTNSQEFQDSKEYYLYEAIGLQSIPLIEKFIAAGADVNSEYSGTTQLNEAISWKNINIVKKLIDLGANVNLANPESQYPGSTYTPLLTAVQYNLTSMVELLIAAGADINTSDNEGLTPLLKSILDKNYEITEKLIDLGADVNKPYTKIFNITAIHLAVRDSNMSLINKLITAGADINKYCSNWKGLLRTPLSEAIEERQIDIVKRLLDAGADINKNDKNMTNGQETHVVLHALKFIPMFKTLLSGGLDINTKIIKNQTILASLIAWNDEYMLEFLLKQPGLRINEPTTVERLPPIDAYINLNIKNNLLTEKNKVILALFMHYPGFDKQRLIDNAKSYDIYPYYVSDYILEQLGEGEEPMWEGWTASNISQMNDIFSQSIPANSLIRTFNVNDPQVRSGEVPETMVESLFSFCPICLQYIRHEAKSCMYMSHDCKKNSSRFYHKGLYEKYSYFKSDAFGRPTNVKTVTWCTLCGRICKEHQHYPLTSYTSPTPDLLPGGNPYETDCRKTNGGGGLPEKVWRYRKLREFAHELNQLKGQLTKQQAYERLVEAMWDAPLQQKGVQNLAMTLGKTNVRPNVKTYEWSPVKTEMNVKPVGCFGKTCKQSNQPNVRIGPINWRKTARNKVIQRHKLWQEPERKQWNSELEFPKPVEANVATQGLQPYTGELPVVHTSPPSGWSNFMGIDDDMLVQFRHIEADGTLNNHNKPGEQISQDGLVGILKSRLGNPGSEEFGKCWQFYTPAQQQQLSEEQKSHVCTANLHPDEVDAALDLTNEEHKQLAKNYRTAYTNRFAAVTGGKRQRKTRKYKPRRTVKRIRKSRNHRQTRK